MYSLLIVDDESIIADGLFELFSSHEAFELMVHRAYSATEAIRIARTIRIDILLSDIAMPRMDGLQLHREITRLWPRCKTIFLTGYDHFEYIQSALRGDAADYILKSESDDIMLEAIRKTIRCVELENLERYAMERARQDRKLVSPLLASKLIGEIIDGDSGPAGDRRSRFEELDIPLDADGPVLILLAAVDFWPDDYTNSMKARALLGVKDIVDEHLAPAVLLQSAQYGEHRLVWLMQPAGSGGTHGGAARLWEDASIYLQGMMSVMQSSFKQALGISVSLAAQSKPVDWSDLAGRFAALQSAMTRSFVFKNELLLIDGWQFDEEESKNAKINDAGHEIRRELRKTRALADLLDCGKREEFNQLFDAMMRGIQSKGPFRFELGVEIYYTLSLLFVSYLNKSGTKDRVSRTISLNPMIKMDEHMPWEHIARYFRDLANAIFELGEAERCGNANRVLSFIDDYIQRHIDQDLTVIAFAELLHFHPIYLSRLFKQATGKNLSEYILDAKIDKARQMMRQENLKINEIAAQLGFTSSSYFAKVFKKHTNLNPQEYRELSYRGGDIITR